MFLLMIKLVQNMKVSDTTRIILFITNFEKKLN